MNIQFRKIHLPPLPKVNANALMNLAGNNGNNILKIPSLPVGIPKNQVISRSNLNEIIQDIENHQTENITALEWVYCLYNKDKWDAQNPDKSISTSEAIWKAAEYNFWLKQRLFWNLALDLSGEQVLASSLAKSYSIFSPQDWLDKGRLTIIQALKAKYPIKDFIELCWSELLTPRELLAKYQLPTTIFLTKASYDYVVPQFCTNDTINLQEIKWLLQCLEQMTRQQQVRAVEYLLTELNPKLGAEHPELIDWLRQNYGAYLPNSYWHELSSTAKAAMRKWIGAVSYQDFRKLVQFIIDRLYLEEWEQRRLRNRSKFWSNYSDRFERIRILLPQSSVNILGSYLNHQDVSILLDDGSDATEICIFDFGDWFVVEFFRGDGSETSIIRKDIESEQTLFHSQLSVKLLRCLDSEIHDHEVCWQYSCEKWLRQKNIFPNEGIRCFQGLSFEIGKYNPEIGLPKPSAEKLQERKYKVEKWKQDIIRLEREAKEYCDEN